MSARDVRGFNVWVRCFLARSCVGAADMHDMCLWLFRASWCSSIGIARWSLRVASAADRCAELSPLSRITVPCRPEMSGASAFSLGTLCLVCSRVRAADTHDVCVWLWHASFGAAFRSWHGGHFGWRVLPTAALSCCAPTEHHCAMSARDVRGFSSVFGYFAFWLARASEPLICTTCACGSGVRAGAAFRYCAVVTSSGECC